MKMYGGAFDPNQKDDDGGDADELEADRTVSSDAEEPSSESELTVLGAIIAMPQVWRVLS